MRNATPVSRKRPAHRWRCCLLKCRGQRRPCAPQSFLLSASEFDAGDARSRRIGRLSCLYAIRIRIAPIGFLPSHGKRCLSIRAMIPQRVLASSALARCACHSRATTSNRWGRIQLLLRQWQCRPADRHDRTPVTSPPRAAAYYFFRNESTSTPACLRMARSVPSGMSPGWLGMVV